MSNHKVTGYPRKKAMKAWAFGAFLSISIAVPSAVQALDVSQGAYTPAPKGTLLMMAYLGASKSTSYEPASGPKLDSGTRFSTVSQLVRFFYVTEINEMPLQWQFNLPAARTDSRLNGNDIGSVSGFGDMSVGVTLWPINNREAREHLGVTLSVGLPTGKYDHQRSLNVGGNRYTGTLQAGYTRGFGSWQFDSIADVAAYGANDKFGPSQSKFEQRRSYSFQQWIGYRIEPSTGVHLGFSKNWGGASNVDAVDTGRRTDSLRLRAGLSHWFSKKTQIYTEVGRDVAVRGGYRFDYNATLRLAHAF